ncbi:DUF2243 domain-containing protein [soil metagenome]
MTEPTNRRPLIASSVLLGIGLGGFVDGIVFHQILQWHNMLSGWRPPTDLVSVEVNMFWDGLFHALTWTMTALGLAMLWSAVRRPEVPLSTRTFVGSMFVGWGLFNLVEGVIDHHILGVHHVVEGAGHPWYDLAFLASGVIFLAGGSAAIHSGRNDPASGRTPAPTA